MSRHALMSSRRTLTLAALLLGLGFGTVRAQQVTAPAPQQYTLLIYETPADFAMRTHPAQAEGYWSRFAAFAATMQQAGVLRGGAALEGGAAVRRVGAGKALVRSESLEPSGYFIIEVADLAAAERWAAQVPAAARGLVEIRAHVISPAMKR